MQTQPDKHSHSDKSRIPDVLFACAFLLISLFLVSQIGNEAKFSAKGKLFAQPAFWPALSLVGMVIFGAGHLWQETRKYLLRQKIHPQVSVTGDSFMNSGSWFGVIEFYAYFMVYVWTVPELGYLFSTVLFVIFLAIRIGYRSSRMLSIAAATGVAIVVGFKSFLAVNIPGAAWYEMLPERLANFMITRF